MEGDNCHAIRTDLPKTTNDELHDSGCEQSPTAPSPDRECSPSDKSESSRVKTYDREFLLSMQFTPHALNPDPAKLLCAKYVQRNGGGHGIFDPSRCYYTKSDTDKLASRKEIQGEYFKTVHEEMLRPQRKSFGSGCQMRNGANTESSDKAGGKTNGTSQRRSSESSDRPRSVPTVERKIGSGRLGERSDSRGSTDRGVTSREKPSRVQTSADKFSNWRQRKNDEELDFTDDRRPAREGKDHRSGYNGARYRKQDAEPEWMIGSIQPGDTIELKGFDGHQDRIDRKEKKEKEKKKKAESRIAKEVIVEDVTADLARALNNDSEPTPSDATDSDKTDKFDFDAFMSKQTGQSTEPPPESPKSSTTTTASRFSRWFKQQDGGTTCYEPLKPESPLPIPSSSGSFPPDDDLNSDDHWNSVVSQWILPSGLDDEPSPEMRHDQPSSSSSGNKILEMLQGAFESSSKADQQKTKDESDQQLPAALTQLLNTAATDPKPHLPTKFKTLAELEAPLTKPETVKPASRPVVREKPAIPTSTMTVASDSSLGTSESAASSSGGSMAAFNKLVGMLEVTGELEKPIPRMPAVTNKETPNQLKKLLEPRGPPTAPSVYQEGRTDGSPLLHSVRPRQSAAGHVDSSRPAPFRPAQHHQMASSSPAAVLNSLPPNMLLNPVMGGLPPPVVSNPLAALQSPAAVNPLIQHTLQQRQNPPSPIMFGAQPPGHIVAPAPIHPASPGRLSHAHQPQAMRAQHSLPLTNQFHSGVSTAPPTAQPSHSSTSMSSVAFTPTSVMRKRANDKVDGRHKQAGDCSSGHELNMHNSGHNSPQSMRPIVKGTPSSGGNQHAREDDTSCYVERMRGLVVDMAQPAQPAQPAQHMLPQQLHMFPQQQQHFSPQHQLGHMFQPMNSMNGFYQQQMAPPIMARPPFNLQHNGAAASLDSIHQLAALQQAHHGQPPHTRTMLSQQALNPSNMAVGEKSDLTKWFCGAELSSHQPLPLPSHANMLTLDDIEH